MKLNFIKVNPSENMTVFVTDALPREKYFEIANKIMNYNNLHAEQVGFIERPEKPENGASARLQMMGGEFCGNASRALAAVAVERGFLNIAEHAGKYTVPLEASGIEGVISCEVEQKSPNGYEVALSMPLHKSVRAIEVEYRNRKYAGTVVDLSGISHAVFFTEDKSLGEDFFDAVRATINDFDYDAFGIMFYDDKEEFMRPLVYVKDTDSLIWERSCGTGTVALGVVLSHSCNGSIDKNINQPGGRMQITTAWGADGIESIVLKGMVFIVAEGSVNI
jgi:diaminopimelate epimerase